LRKHLLQLVPDYLVPSAFVFIASMPLTPNGKIDRAKLSVADVDQHLDTTFIAPSNDLEEALCRIWAEVLSAPRVGVEDNFFDLGGHSLLAIQIRSRIKDAFGINLPLRNFFDEPTVALLATRIESALIKEIESLDDEEATALTRQIRRRGDGEPQ
jgi:acyl carrier protein